MIRLRAGFKSFGHDLRTAATTLWRERSAQAVILLFLLPWIGAVAVHRNLNVLTPLGQIVGLIVLYWFFTRGRAYSNLPVARPSFETIAVLVFVAAWIIYRVGEYLHWIDLPPINMSCCGNLTDTIIPKTVEMFLLPLVLFLFLRYSLPKLGLGLPVKAWVPALFPLVYLLVQGLNHHRQGALLDRTLTFYLAAGLPEEFLFRGLVQSRLESLTGRPVWGLLLGAFAFGLSHLPIDLYGSGWSHWETAVENAFTFQMGVGLGLGFAFQRTRNLWPLTLIHALIDAAPLL